MNSLQCFRKMRTLIILCTVICLTWAVPIQKWHRTTDGCLYYVEKQISVNWYQAWEECLNKNMTLITIDSYNKQKYVDNLIDMFYASKFSYWLAAHDNAVAKRHVWATTGKPMYFTNWAKGQPTYSTNYHCIYSSSNDGQWYDTICTNTQYFICENLQCTTTESNDDDFEYGGVPKELKKYNVNIWNHLGHP
ncbi:lectin subunit alpha-like [Musca autumnalis]|uniref:lectin subunit alpha-like n=1 Tax=Musca autumnalis TaxID=221902 RepID=UPI003CE9DF1D